MDERKSGSGQVEYSREKRNTFLYLKKKLNYKVPQELQERLKEQTKIVNVIKKALKSGPKTVPEISKETGIDTSTIFWYVSTLLRYAVVEIVEKTDDGYLKYALKESK